MFRCIWSCTYSLVRVISYNCHNFKVICRRSRSLPREENPTDYLLVILILLRPNPIHTVHTVIRQFGSVPFLVPFLLLYVHYLSDPPRSGKISRKINFNFRNNLQSACTRHDTGRRTSRQDAHVR
jgi:hypothetical protein